MKAKIIVLMILIILFTIFVSQNTEVVTVNAFFWPISMSLIVLMVILGFVGVIVGFIAAKFSEKSSKKISDVPKEVGKKEEKSKILPK